MAGDVLVGEPVRCGSPARTRWPRPGEDGSFDSPGFVKAGEELKKLIDIKPFQDGHLAAPWDGAGGEAAQLGNGKAAMDLMGQWAPSTFAANAKDGDKVLADLGWFPFPTVDGGAGAGDRAVRRRRRLRVRQGRAAGGARLRQVPGDVRRRQQGGRERRHPAGQERRRDLGHRPEHEVRAGRARATRRSSSSTSTRRTRPPSARRSTTPCRSCSRARPPRRTSPARSRMRPRPDSALVAGLSSPPASVRRARRTRARRRWTTIALFLAPGARRSTGCWSSRRCCRRSYYSGFKWNGLGALDDFVGLENFKRAFGDDVFTGALRHNFVFVVLSLADPAAVRAGGRADAAGAAARAARCCASCTSRRSCSRRSSPAWSGR